MVKFGVLHKFLPLERCMYCGSMEGPLTQEHIIPRGLNGNILAPRATCERCRLITQDIEKNTVGTMLGIFRLRAGFAISKPKKRPSSVTVPIGSGQGPTFKIVDNIRAPLDEQPRLIVLPTLAPPGLVTGTSNAWKGDFWYSLDDADMHLISEDSGGQGPQHAPLHPLYWFRLLAKVAHGFATMVEGYGAFHPLITRLILGDSTRVGRLIGCDPDQTPSGSNDLHCLRLDYYKINGRDYVGVNVRLLNSYGAPDYIVIVGERAKKGFSLSGHYTLGENQK